jgi:hypothetical protein
MNPRITNAKKHTARNNFLAAIESNYGMCSKMVVTTVGRFGARCVTVHEEAAKWFQAEAVARNAPSVIRINAASKVLIQVTF